MARYQRDRYLRRRDEAETLLGRVCLHCGKRRKEMHLVNTDRKRGRKTFTQIQAFAKANFLTALESWVLECAECHIGELTEDGELPAIATCGSKAKYRHHGCRCADCRRANTDAQHAWKARRAASGDPSRLSPPCIGATLVGKRTEMRGLKPLSGP
jgi:hypothetical protein